MKKLLLLLLLVVITAAGQAQKVYFIYLQSDNGSPFFVKMGEKVRSSAAAGYLILDNLVDSTYTFSVGFPAKTTESKFAVAINKEDKGFLLKTFETGLGLFDLQSLTVTKAIAATKDPVPVDAAIIAAADPFTRLLAQAADEPGLYFSGPNPSVPKETASIAKEEPMAEVKADVTIVVPIPVATNTSLAVLAIKKEQALTVTDSVNSIDKAEVPIVSAMPVAELPKAIVIEKAAPEIEEAYQRSVVMRRSESSTTEGFGLVFLDKDAATTDTIRLLIPNPKVVAKIVEPVEAVKSADTPVMDNEPKALMGNSANRDSVIVTIAKQACEAIATDKDFLKLRKNMAAAEDEPEMLSIARKDFSRKCFSTEQVKNLGTLFLSVIGKYNFFEAAYTHVSDADQFAQLETELKDETYSKRFKALLVK